MYVVVNHLRFRDPVTDDTVRAFCDVVQLIVDAGAIAARVLRVEDTHFILLLDFSSSEEANRVARKVGGPWMRENILPLLAGGTERSVGAVIASADR